MKQYPEYKLSLDEVVGVCAALAVGKVEGSYLDVGY